MNRIRTVLRHQITKIIVYVIVIWLVGALIVYLCERNEVDPDTGRKEFDSFFKACWNVVVYITSGFDTATPTTTPGRFSAVLILILSVGIIGVFTGTVASVLIEHNTYRNKIAPKSARVKLKEHIILCGWNDRADRIIRELRQDVLKGVLNHGKKWKDIVIISDVEEITVPDSKLYPQVWLLTGEPTGNEVLDVADIQDADTAIILADYEEGSRADSKTLLTALAIKTKNPEVYTCAELVEPKNQQHFRGTRVDELVVISEVSEKLLAQSAINHGITDFYEHLLKFSADTNEVYRLALEEEYTGTEFIDLFKRFAQQGVILIGVVRRIPQRDKDGSIIKNSKGEILYQEEILVNPSKDYQFLWNDEEKDSVLVIATRKPQLSGR
jgi:voltage-gated potassium channel